MLRVGSIGHGVQLTFLMFDICEEDEMIIILKIMLEIVMMMMMMHDDDLDVMIIQANNIHVL